MRIQEGDIILVPATSARSCIGQAVAVEGHSFLLATFSIRVGRSASMDLDKLDLDRPEFMVIALDANLESGRWRIIGNRAVTPACCRKRFGAPAGHSAALASAAWSPGSGPIRNEAADGAKYVLRSAAKSYDGWTAEYFKPGAK
ncbi:hypothetical protein [Acrocarpospora catenulata]|uniref:hypothetical protein n=1 Tax=Acrocarpospora catenulata TaxID=2836182 RepID=UPI001BD97891|nr:hypothetical protein [Acrocarpospora catenulata]